MITGQIVDKSVFIQEMAWHRNGELAQPYICVTKHFARFRGLGFETMLHLMKQFDHNWHLPCCQCMETCSHVCSIQNDTRDHFVYVTSQWEMTLHCNVISHWLGTCTKWSLVSFCNVTSSLIGWVHSQNDPCDTITMLVYTVIYLKLFVPYNHVDRIFPDPYKQYHSLDR